MRRTIAASIVSALVGATGMYFYTRENVVRREAANQLVLRFEEVNKKYQDLTSAKSECESYRKLHEQQEGVFYAESLQKSAEIRKLNRRLLVLFVRHGEVRELRTLLDQNRELAKEFSSETFQENWLHTTARSHAPFIGEVTKAFIDFGADPNALSLERLRPIDIARQVGTMEVIEVLETYKPREPIRVSAN